MVLERSDWDRLDALLQAALELPGAERQAFIERETAGDAGLRERLTNLVRMAETDGGPIRPGGALESADVAVPRGSAPLPPGTQLGRYRIRSLLGAGGMGSVYGAHDPTLDREVAIKALGHAFRDDPVSLKRFEREARLLAALSHPSIAAIYGFEQLDSAPYLVLEKVDGETLAQRLSRGPLSLREARDIGIQVAEGLEEAHGKGVAHRDLKPSNVMLASGGRVKLVDFGLAKPTGRSRGGTVATNLTTAAGTVMGTAPYMSPEQINGDEADTRTDVWAFGCVLYEMLVGRQAFSGRSSPEVFASILRDEPDLSLLPADAPPAVGRLIQRCLRKDLRARLQHIGDVRLELTELSAELPRPASPEGARRRAWRRGRLPLLFVTAVAVAAALATVALLLQRTRPAPPAAVLSLELPRDLTLASGYTAPFAIAPDGTRIVLEGSVSGRKGLFLRKLDEVTVRPLGGTENAHQPFFSPGGESVGYFADRKLERLPLEGGPPLPLCEIGSNPRGAAWPREGTIVLSPSQTSGLLRVPDGGGHPEPLTTLDAAAGERSHRWPEALPGGTWVVFTVGLEGASYDEARLDAVNLDTLERRRLLTGASYGRYVTTGHLVFVRAGRVYAVAFDPRSLRVSGAPEAVLTGVRFDPQNGAAHLALSPTGALLYGPGVPTSPETFLSWLHRDGRLERLSATARSFRDPRLSPDGSRVAVVVGTSAESDLWTVDAGGELSQVSFGLSPHRPTWRPDGRHVTVAAQNGAAWRLLTLSAGGNAEPTVLLESRARVYPNAWSPDGRFLLFQESNAETGWDLNVLEVSSSGWPVGSPRAFATSPFHEANAAISPDGRWVAYESDELDALVQVHVRSFPAGDVKSRASTGGARWPVWGPDGELVFWDTSGHRMVAVSTGVPGAEAVTPGEPRPVFPAGLPALSRLVISVTGSRFDVEPGGRRFLILETSAETVEPPLSRPVVALGFGEELRRRIR